MAEITPTFVQNFQTNLTQKVSNAWSRTNKNLFWDKLAVKTGSSTLKEYFEWMLETAQIRNTGSKGTELEFEDVAAISFGLQNENFGTALRLERNAIEDNKYDRAALWAGAAGQAAAYHPQRKIVELILNGKTGLGYDGVAFFSASHPVNPYDTAAGTFSNLFTAKPLTAANLAAVVASIVSIKHPGDAPRYLRPSILVVDPSKELAAAEITGAEIITDPLNGSSAAPATNMIKRAYNFGQPIVVPELASEPGVYYVGVEADEDALGGAFIYQERKPFELNSYVGMTQAELDRINAFEWHMRGRNVAAYGHPYLFFRVEPT